FKWDCPIVEKRVNVYAFGEGKPMNVGILVPFSSAQRLAGRNSYKVEDANHMEVCKPTRRDHISYTLLLKFIKEVARENHYEALHLSQAIFGLESYVERRPCIIQEHMKTLSPEDSWSLFCVHAFGTSSSVPHRLEASAKSMAEECGDDPEIDAYDLLMKLRRRSLIESIANLDDDWHTERQYEHHSNWSSRIEEFHKRLAEEFDEHSDGELDEELDEELDGESDEDLHVDLDEDLDEGLVPGYVGDDPEIDAYDLSMKLRRRSLIESIEKLDANLDDVWEERQLNRKLLNEKLHEGFHELLDEDLDEQSDGELDEESDEELDGQSDEDLHEWLDEDLDEDLDEESDEKVDEEVFPQYKECRNDLKRSCRKNRKNSLIWRSFRIKFSELDLY
ncbi:unnamed protein product, partial [Sphagnum jensenii]